MALAGVVVILLLIAVVSLPCCAVATVIDVAVILRVSEYITMNVTVYLHNLFSGKAIEATDGRGNVDQDSDEEERREEPEEFRPQYESLPALRLLCHLSISLVRLTINNLVIVQ